MWHTLKLLIGLTLSLNILTATAAPDNDEHRNHESKHWVPWIFVGCAMTKQQCWKMADYEYFKKSSLEYNPTLCISHPHGACFGWHEEGGNYTGLFRGMDRH